MCFLLVSTDRSTRNFAQPARYTGLRSTLGSGTDSPGYHQDKKLCGKDRDVADSDQIHADDTAAVLKVM
jgi:hypothetical protein